MRLVSLPGLCVVSLSAAVVAFTACGSSDDKKKVPAEYDSGGEGGAAEPTGGKASGGAGRGGGGMGGTGGIAMNDGGVGGVPLEPQGGAAGATDVEPLGGAGAGGDGSVMPFHGLYVAVTGDDTKGDGTVAKPFASLSKVAAAAQAGDTIVFLNGTYTVTGKQIAPTVIPDGVNVMAETAGGVAFTGENSAALFKLAGSSQIEGFKFNNFQSVIEFVDGPTATGTLTLKDSSFLDCGTQCLLLSGTTTTNIEVAADAVLGNGKYNFALLSNQASLNVTRGIFENFLAGGNVVNATDDAVVTLDGVSFDSCQAKAVLLDKKAAAHLSNVTISNGGPQLIVQKGQSALTIADSDLSIKSGDTGGICLRLEMDGLGSTEITDSKLHDCNTGMNGSIPASLTLTRVEAYNMKFAGLDLSGFAGGSGVVVRIVDSNFHDFGNAALRINNGANFTDLKFRGSKFIVSDVKSTWDAVTLQTSLGSKLDLGTAADPGGNTFLVANVNNTALRLGTQGTAMKANAVGNTWIPGVQNADAQGHYNAPAGAGMKLEDSSGVAGRNYAAPYNGSSILLAQNP